MSAALARAAVLGALALAAAGVALAGSTGRCGGEGGDKRAVLRCPEGQYIVGIGARGDNFLNTVSISCAPFDARGNRGQRQRVWSHGGATGGTTYREGVCRGNGAAVRLAFFSGSFVDFLDSFRCGDMAVMSPDNPASAGDDKQVTVGVGNRHPWQPPCNITCPTGEALTQLTVRYGAWVDSIAGVCRPPP